MAEIEEAPDMSPMALPRPLENALFGKYDLGRLLGYGAYAKVYHARDLRNGQSVAIKIINKKQIAANTTLMSNIKREISIMRKLNHPHIVKLFEMLASTTKIYFVMEFVTGGELFAKIKHEGRLNEELSRKYFQQLISAVGYCHSRGVYHRDLKPENLLLDENGDIKVSDFGLSAVKDQVRQDGLLHTRCGTSPYVAPEILSNKGYEGAKVDVWSCGIILFVLRAGYLPFNDRNLTVLYKKIFKGEYRCPRRMSSEFKRVLSRILDTNPTTRITIDEIKRDPWFKKGYEDVKFYDEDYDVNKVVKHDENVGGVRLNAFDLISFCPILDLSALFDKSGTDDNSDYVVVETTLERIIDKVEEIVKEEGNVRLKKKKKEWRVELVGQDGKFRIRLEIFQLTDNLVVVESKRIAGEAIFFNELWEEKIKPEICAR